MVYLRWQLFWHFYSIENNIILLLQKLRAQSLFQIIRILWRFSINIHIIQECFSLEQCFPTFFGLRHPYIVFKIFGGTPG